MSPAATPRSLASSALIACALSSSLACAIELPPPPQDPKLAQTFAQAQELLTRASASGYMDLPAQQQAWPCAIDEVQLRRLVGAVSSAELDARGRRSQRLMYAGVGMRDSEMQTTISDVRLVPLAAQCKDGKLDGPLEFMLQSTRTMDMPTASTEIRSRVRFQGVIAGGERVPTAPIHVATWTYGMATTFKDAATRKLMENVKTPQVLTLSANTSLPQDADAAWSATIIETRTGASQREWMTLFTQPTGARRNEMTNYRGAALWMRQSMKNGLQHGVVQTFPFQVGAGAAAVTVPGSLKCYEDGEEIKTTQCTVD